MIWQFGIDEAGYGPNLGPLVQACVGFLLPEDDPSGWKTFAKMARRVGEPADDRLVIDDSKKVYTSGGLVALERTVSTVQPIHTLKEFMPDHDLLEATLDQERWYRGDQKLPIEIDADERQRLLGLWLQPAILDIGTYQILPYVTATPRFNEIVRKHGSKSAVILDRIKAMIQLCCLGMDAHLLDVHKLRPARFLCDKLGGRHYYGPFLQEVFPDGWPVAEVESAEESRYRIMNLNREVTVSFMPRADAASLPVALASMVAKYFREVCMRQFNAYWRMYEPKLEPTAGYPVDAKRFYAAIEPAMKRLGITREQVWREK